MNIPEFSNDHSFVRITHLLEAFIMHIKNKQTNTDPWTQKVNLHRISEYSEK